MTDGTKANILIAAIAFEARVVFGRHVVPNLRVAMTVDHLEERMF